MSERSLRSAVALDQRPADIICRDGIGILGAIYGSLNNRRRRRACEHGSTRRKINTNLDVITTSERPAIIGDLGAR